MRASSPLSENDTPRSHAGLSSNGQFVGFDRNDYPGDATMASMRNTFAFTGYWLNNPPGEDANPWLGKRSLLRNKAGDFSCSGTAASTKKSSKPSTPAPPPQRSPGPTPQPPSPRRKAKAFPQRPSSSSTRKRAVVCSTSRPLTSSAGPKPSPPPATALASTPAASLSPTVPTPRPSTPSATSAPVSKKAASTIIAIFNAQDSCPPAPGCTTAAKPLATSGSNSTSPPWQYAQSPRRTNITKSCGTTYAADGNCYAPGFPEVFLDMDTATTADPSHGR